MLSDSVKKEIGLDRNMIKLIDEFDPSSFRKLVYEVKEVAGTKASIPFSALAERKAPELGQIARSACLNLLQRRIVNVNPEQDPHTYQFHWLDPYFQYPSTLEMTEINTAITNRNFEDIDLLLTLGHLGICQTTLKSIDRLGLQDRRLVDPLISCLQIPIVAHVAARMLYPYKEPRAIPGLIWIIKYHQNSQNMYDAVDTLSEIGQPALEPLVLAYQTFDAYYKQLNVPYAPWRERVHELLSDSSLFPAVQQLADGMIMLARAIEGIYDPLALREFRLLLKNPTPKIRELAKNAIKINEDQQNNK